jgi:hypothetical protein
VESGLKNAAAMKETKHAIKSPERTGVCIVGEHPDRIVIEFRFSRYGELGDEAELIEWLCSLRERYRNDGRPIVFRNYLSFDAQTAAEVGNLAMAGLLIAVEK